MFHLKSSVVLIIRFVFEGKWHTTQIQILAGASTLVKYLIELCHNVLLHHLCRPGKLEYVTCMSGATYTHTLLAEVGGGT